jgi:hypothetical protein
MVGLPRFFSERNTLIFAVALTLLTACGGSGDPTDTITATDADTITVTDADTVTDTITVTDTPADIVADTPADIVADTLADIVADSGSSDVVADDTVVAPTDSKGGDASVDAGNADPCGSTASSSCVAVSGTCEVNGGPCFDLGVVGSQFDEFEGQIVRVVTNAHGVDLTAAGTVIGVAQAKIVGGAFTLSLPLTLSDYTGISLYIDHNCSSTCDVGEPMWGMTTSVTATFDTPYLLELTADDLSPFDLPASPWVGGCANNGADLALNLPCQP